MPTPAQEIQAQVSKELAGFVTIIGKCPIPFTLYAPTRLLTWDDRAIPVEKERNRIVVVCVITDIVRME